MRRSVALAVLLLFVGGLLAAHDPKPDNKTAAAQVRAADLGFAAAAKAKDLEKFLSFVDDDVMFFVAGRMMVGKEAERKNWQSIFSDPEIAIVWSPELVEATADMGYTTGPFEITRGGKLERKGRYATIWRRKPDGSWKVALDIGVNEPPQEEKKQ